MVQTLHTSASIFMSAYTKMCSQSCKANYSKSPQWINLILVSSERYPYLLMQQTNFEV